VVFGVNTSWLRRPQAIEYTNAAKVNPDVFQKSKVESLGVVLPAKDDIRWDRYISDFVTQNWALYRNRSNIAAAILGKSLGEKLYDGKYIVYDPISYQKQLIYWRDVFIPWYKKDYSKDFKKNTRKFGWISLDAKNPQVKFYQLILDLIKEEKMTAFFYTTPINYEMFDKYNKLDRSSLAKNMAKLQTISRPEETNFVDLSYALPGKYYSDSLHLLPPGNKQLAVRLATEISQKGLIK
jgi:hypothetical protein